MCRGDNLVDWNFQYCIVICVHECLNCSIREILLYAYVRFAYLSCSKIRLTMYHGDYKECIIEITSPITYLKVPDTSSFSSGEPYQTIDV